MWPPSVTWPVDNPLLFLSTLAFFLFSLSLSSFLYLMAIPSHLLKVSSAHSNPTTHAASVEAIKIASISYTNLSPPSHLMPPHLLLSPHYIFLWSCLYACLCPQSLAVRPLLLPHHYHPLLGSLPACRDEWSVQEISSGSVAPPPPSSAVLMLLPWRSRNASLQEEAQCREEEFRLFHGLPAQGDAHTTVGTVEAPQLHWPRQNYCCTMTLQQEKCESSCIWVFSLSFFSIHTIPPLDES